MDIDWKDTRLEGKARQYANHSNYLHGANFMKAIVLKTFQPQYTGLKLADVPQPTPSKGQVLLRVLCSPINPADYLVLNDDYIVKREPPFVAGLLAVGEVIDHAAGLQGRFLKGKRAWFGSSPTSGGVWAEFALAEVDKCVPLKKELSDEQAMNMGNAVTAVAMLQSARARKARGVILTAAASNLGRLFNTLALQEDVPVINLVRSEAQVSVLRNLGATYVLNTEESNFEGELQKLAQQLNATAAFDSVCGTMPTVLMNAMPDGSVIWLVGRLSSESMQIDGLGHMIACGFTLQGFAIESWLERYSLPTRLRIVQRAQKLITATDQGDAQHRLSLAEALEKLGELEHGTTAGKAVIYPSR